MPHHGAKSSFSAKRDFVYVKHHFLCENRSNTLLSNTFQPKVNTLGLRWPRHLAQRVFFVGRLWGGSPDLAQPSLNKTYRLAYAKHTLSENIVQKALRKITVSWTLSSGPILKLPKKTANPAGKTLMIFGLKEKTYATPWGKEHVLRET